MAENCEGSGNCCDCNLWDCYYNESEDYLDQNFLGG